MGKVTLHICIISSLALFVYSGSAQNSWIDSLRQVVVTQKADTNKILTLQHISNYYSFNDPDSGIIYAKEAIALAEKLEYDQGIFRSIVSGNYSLELQYALKALQRQLISLSIRALSYSGKAVMSFWKTPPPAIPVITRDWALLHLQWQKKMDFPKYHAQARL